MELPFLPISGQKTRIVFSHLVTMCVCVCGWSGVKECQFFVCVASKPTSVLEATDEIVSRKNCARRTVCCTLVQNKYIHHSAGIFAHIQLRQTQTGRQRTNRNKSNRSFQFAFFSRGFDAPVYRSELNIDGQQSHSFMKLISQRRHRRRNDKYINFYLEKKVMSKRDERKQSCVGIGDGKIRTTLSVSIEHISQWRSNEIGANDVVGNRRNECDAC